ncbi:MAG: hypothetical protein IJZ57_01140 [Clostridia bacterium]|nr:hypothetical protein [Clostridia bacterium]
MPFAAFQGEDVAANQKVAGEYLSQNGFDIVAVQEDFGFHKHLVNSMEGFDYETNHTGGIPGGDPLHTSLTPYERFCYAILSFSERCIG